MPDGGTIEVSAGKTFLEENETDIFKTGEYILLTIRDNGPGIPEKIIGHIFEPFFSTRISGRGLGLATAYSIIRRHNGAITVESPAGTGAVFSIYLPSSKNELQEKEPGTGGEARHGGNRVLVMDDEKMLRNMLSEIFDQLGYSSVCTSDGQEAVKKHAESIENGFPFAAAILDLTIPGGMGGLEAAGEIRKKDRDIPLFVSSGYASDPVMADPAAYGFTDCIKKPFSISRLSEIMNRHTGKP